MRNFSPLSILNYIFYFCCFLGCAWQYLEISRLYFGYQVITEISMVMPKEVMSKALSVCFRYKDIVNITSYDSHYHGNGSHSHNITDENKLDLLNKMTIKELFEYTPPTSDMVYSCKVRLPREYTYYHYNGSECLKIFKITKFYVQEYLCYMFDINVDGIYDFKTLTFAPTYPDMFYHLDIFNEAVPDAQIIKPILHAPHKLPSRSISFAHYFHQTINKTTNKVLFDRFRVAYETASLTRLKAPYTSNCRVYEESGLGSDSDCFRQCLINQAIKNFNKVPFSTLMDVAYDYQHIRFIDLQNNTLRNILRELQHGCGHQCKQANCEEKYVLSRVNRETGVGDLSFTVNAPKDLHVNIEFFPKMLFQEYMIYALSVFGTWFGFSIFSINPFRYFLKTKSSQKHDRFKMHNCYHCLVTKAMIQFQVKHEIDHLIDKLLSVEYNLKKVPRFNH